jgi:hypothetical protein
MMPQHDQRQRRAPRARGRRPGPFQSLREWWWNQDRRRHIKQLVTDEYNRAREEVFVIDALARQLEEIRNLPEVGC